MLSLKFFLLSRANFAYRVTFTGVKKDVSHDELREAFRAFGHVRNLSMDMNPYLGEWSGTGCVDYQTEDAARDAASANVILIRKSLIRLRDAVNITNLAHMST